jgi:hypothetical protein
MKRLFIFDLDKTLYKTPEPLDGVHVFKEKMGFDYPHKGWFSKKESLDIKIFDIELNDWVYQEYLKSREMEDTYVVLCTGRIKPLREVIEIILERDGIKFDDIFCNWGGPTLKFKLKVFESLKEKFKDTLEEIYVYDDRDEHIGSFMEWALQVRKDTDINAQVIHVK